MRELRVTPETAQEILEQATAGDVIVFAPGRYTTPLTLSDKHGTEQQPITLRGEPGAVFTPHATDAEYNPEADRIEANEIAKARQDNGKFPCLFDIIDHAQLTVDRSRHVVIEGMEFKQGWPTHIYVNESPSVTIRNTKMQDGTYAIALNGEATRNINIDHVSWVQDPVPDHLWRTVAWKDIHGAPPDEPPVNVQNDSRILDGQFVSIRNTGGHIAITDSFVSDAFNVMRMTKTGPHVDDLNNDITVTGNIFERIRDNVVDAEQGGRNWQFSANDFRQAYKPIALESSDPAAYQNFRFTHNFINIADRPGPPNDEHHGTCVFKIDGDNSYEKSTVLFEGNTVIGNANLFSDAYTPPPNGNGIIAQNNTIIDIDVSQFLPANTAALLPSTRINPKEITVASAAL